MPLGDKNNTHTQQEAQANKNKMTRKLLWLLMPARQVVVVFLLFEIQGESQGQRHVDRDTRQVEKQIL